MLAKESLWIGNTLLELAAKIPNFSLLNVGSSTWEFRHKTQAFVYENIFRPLEEKQIKVTHLDMKADKGVDIVGDLTEAAFRTQLKALNYTCLLSSNLLEHVTQREEICAAMLDSVGKNGYLLITVPHIYHYHRDPIDTKFRPSVADLHALFPNTTLVKGEIVSIEDTYFKWLLRHPKSALLRMAKLLMPWYEYTEWKKQAADIPNLFRAISVACILLKKNA